MKTGRNSPCPCGCGRKYKVCQAENRLAAENAAKASAGKWYSKRLSLQKSQSLFAIAAAIGAVTSGNYQPDDVN